MRVAFVLLSLALPLAAAPVPKTLKKTATIDGDWRWESQEKLGQVSPASEGDYTLWRVDGNTMTLIRDQGGRGVNDRYPCQLTSEVNADGVRTFEYKVNSNGYHRRGVCVLDGDTLRIAFSSTAGTPPKAVKSDDDVTVYIFRRVTDSK